MSSDAKLAGSFHLELYGPAPIVICASPPATLRLTMSTARITARWRELLGGRSPGLSTSGGRPSRGRRPQTDRTLDHHAVEAQAGVPVRPAH